MKKILETIKKDLCVVFLDIVAVNAGYFLALLIRFYVNFTLRPIAVKEYLPAWSVFTPWYTVLAILIFAAWRLYGGMWRYAGINDMNRVILANVCTAVVHVIGTLAFVRRMPITYYIIGFALQLLFVVLIRFSYRMFLVEKTRLTKVEKIPALVIGSGDLGRSTVRHLENNTPYHVTVIIGDNPGRNMDGVPVLSFDEMNMAMEKVKAVFIADKGLDDAQRDKIAQVADGKTLTDFTGALSNLSGSIPVSALLGLIRGPITLRLDGKDTSYESGQKALEALHERYNVEEIEASRITLKKAQDFDIAWINQYKEVTGEDISFF